MFVDHGLDLLLKCLYTIWHVIYFHLVGAGRQAGQDGLLNLGFQLLEAG
jgi:hypothetical protein